MLGNSQMDSDPEETFSERGEKGEADSLFLASEEVERRSSGREEKKASSPVALPESVSEGLGGAYFKAGGRVPIRSKVIPLVSATVALLILFTTLLSGSFAAAGQTNTRAEALFQKATCPFRLGAGLVEGREVSCGYLTVPENRETKSGKTIKLAVAIFRSLQYLNTKDPAPVLRLDGGPGSPSLNNIATLITAQNYKTFVFNHDLIMFDQRGVGYSTPALVCSELVGQSVSILSASYEQAANACYKRLQAQGIDLNGFNTIQNAGDVADLIKALGYQQLTLYGVSYGTRLALTVMRLYPSMIRGVVLDSVYPTTQKSFNLPKVAQHVFQTLFAGCKANAVCKTKYPDLEGTLYKVVDRLNASPTNFISTDPTTQKTQTLLLSGDSLVILLFNMFYSVSLIPQIPQLIYRINTLLTLRNQRASSALTIYSALTTERSDGMFFSTECSEDYPFLTRQELLNQQNGVAPQLARPMNIIGMRWYNVCQFWKVNIVPEVQKRAVLSNLPTLVLSGEYDPITPPSYAQEVVSGLSRSFFFFFPGLSHGVKYNSVCSNLIISAFIDNPDQPPSGTCIAQMTEPAFV